jgi:hypothetical protein
MASKWAASNNLIGCRTTEYREVSFCRLYSTNHVVNSSREYNVLTALHERTQPPACKTGNWTAHNGALNRRGSLTIRFDPAMTRGATPPGKRGRRPD